MIEKLTRKDTLINLHNQVLQDLAIAEINVKVFGDAALLNPDPELNKNLGMWQFNLDKAKKTLNAVITLLETETATSPERTLN